MENIFCLTVTLIVHRVIYLSFFAFSSLWQLYKIPTARPIFPCIELAKSKHVLAKIHVEEIFFLLVRSWICRAGRVFSLSLNVHTVSLQGRQAGCREKRSDENACGRFIILLANNSASKNVPGSCGLYNGIFQLHKEPSGRGNKNVDKNICTENWAGYSRNFHRKCFKHDT